MFQVTGRGSELILGASKVRVVAKLLRVSGNVEGEWRKWGKKGIGLPRGDGRNGRCEYDGSKFLLHSLYSEITADSRAPVH